MRRLALLFALCAAGCAASRSGGGERGVPDSRASRHVGVSGAIQAKTLQSTASPAAAPADSLTLRWTAPRYGTRGCGPDTRDTLHGPLRCDVLRLRGQAHAWRPGCEASVACWDSVRAQTVPDTVARLWTMPGAACSVRVAGGEYVVITRNAAGVSCWSQVKGGVR